MNRGYISFTVGGILILALLIQVGCGSPSLLRLYDGVPQPTAQVAILDISSRSVYVMRIDTLVHRYAALTYETIELLPGQHSLDLNYRSWKGGSSKPLTIDFTVQAGHHYKLKATAGYRQWTGWIVDIANDSVIAGSR